MTAIRVRINGSEVADDVPPRLSLADFLRERRNLTGTHLGCELWMKGMIKSSRWSLKLLKAAAINSLLTHRRRFLN